tara:strand:+ start:1876 stop:2958 length:1083 start_codon:yes stop_codon:yes gene_type:complete
MGLRSLGNPLASFLDVFSETVSEKPTASTGIQNIVSTGGNVDARVVGNWTYHTFTSPGTLSLTNASLAKDAEFLLVGGGGSGGVANNNGSDGGGGGGAGNVNTYTGFTTADLGDGDFTITVGTGAGPFPGPPSPGSTVQAPQVGGDSTVVKDGPNAELRAKGGGGGAHGPVGGPHGPYGTGGSGGGGGGGGGASSSHIAPGITNTPQPLLNGAGATITQRGNSGGHGNTPPYYGGGGGGAGGAGIPGAQNPPRGRGGAAAQILGFAGPDIGIPALSPYNGYYGGGGPGGAGGPGAQPANDAPVNGSTPGSPASNGPLQGGHAADYTGGGGGGASGNTNPPGAASPSGRGGPGIVVFRYRQ